jgi:hypothetical protein
MMTALVTILAILAAFVTTWLTSKCIAKMAKDRADREQVRQAYDAWLERQQEGAVGDRIARLMEKRERRRR